MRMAAIFILLASGDCVANMEMSFEEEMNADHNKTVTPVS
jgi:hypothetical protein